MLFDARRRKCIQKASTTNKQGRRIVKKLLKKIMLHMKCDINHHNVTCACFWAESLLTTYGREIEYITHYRATTSLVINPEESKTITQLVAEAGIKRACPKLTIFMKRLTGHFGNVTKTMKNKY